MKRAVFLDRDRTLIEDPGYVSDPERVLLLPGSADAVARLRAAGYHVVVVTNQSGVARGLMTEDQLAAVHQRMQDLLIAQNTGVDALYYCPYLDSDEAVVPAYRRSSELRKPAPGMLKLAAKDLQLDLSRSWMVGDAERDVQAGRAAGCRAIRIGLSPGESTAADLIAADLAGAVDLILRDGFLGQAVRLPTPGEGRPAEPKVAEHGRTEPERSRSSDSPTAAAHDALLRNILDELRAARRDSQRQDFSAAKLGGAVAQAVAVCMLGWGLYASVEAGSANPEAGTDAVIRLLGAIGFQLLALTCFAAGRR